jgi:16S rRNA (cytosine1402-N4)-methyltransferase
MREIYQHTPVLLREVIDFLKPQPNENFIDATMGGGGYSKAILEKVKPSGKVLAIDLDQDAVDNLKSEIGSLPFLLAVQGNFARVDKIAEHHKFADISGIVADLGLSSYELEHRGLSFQTKQILDMRFDQKGQSIDAKYVLNNYEQKRLEKLFTEYGEEKYARQIAKKIIVFRADSGEIKYTADLYQIIINSLPKPVKHKAADSARRIFQALRVEVNHELDNLREFLPKAFDLLNPGGRLAVVSFHSLEDRIVKQYFAAMSKGCVCPPEFPQCICGRNPLAQVLTKKPLTASAEELINNPKAKAAKLRVLKKISS